MKPITAILLIQLCFSFCSEAQQTYLSQKSSTPHTEKSNKEPSGFVGCIDYKITYMGLPTNDPDMQEKATFLVEDHTENYGIKKTYCFNENGDVLEIYVDAKQVDRVWYFADSNEEYTLFTNGVLKFSVNNEAEPEGLKDLAITRLEKTEESKTVLGHELYQVILQRKSGDLTEYWISDDLLRNNASFENNKFAFTNEIMQMLPGQYLYKRKVVADFFVTIEEAVQIHQEPPNADLFVLPNVDLYKW